MLHIMELGVSLGVDSQKNFIGRKDGDTVDLKINSLPKNEVRQELLKICSELKEVKKLIEQKCENEKCNAIFFSQRVDAKYCSNRCRQAKRYEKIKKA